MVSRPALRGGGAFLGEAIHFALTAFSCHPNSFALLSQPGQGFVARFIVWL
jgi:hypothetical protein